MLCTLMIVGCRWCVRYSFSFPEQEWGHLSEEVRDLIR
jgi:hypothetical protein